MKVYSDLIPESVISCLERFHNKFDLFKYPSELHLRRLLHIASIINKVAPKTIPIICSEAMVTRQTLYNILHLPLFSYIYEQLYSEPLPKIEKVFKKSPYKSKTNEKLDKILEILSRIDQKLA